MVIVFTLEPALLISLAEPLTFSVLLAAQSVPDLRMRPSARASMTALCSGSTRRLSNARLFARLARRQTLLFARVATEEWPTLALVSLAQTQTARTAASTLFPALIAALASRSSRVNALPARATASSATSKELAYAIATAACEDTLLFQAGIFV